MAFNDSKIHEYLDNSILKKLKIKQKQLIALLSPFSIYLFYLV